MWSYVLRSAAATIYLLDSQLSADTLQIVGHCDLPITVESDTDTMAGVPDAALVPGSDAAIVGPKVRRVAVERGRLRRHPVTRVALPSRTRIGEFWRSSQRGR